MKRTFTATATLLTASLFLAGCTGDTPNPTDPTTTEPSVTINSLEIIAPANPGSGWDQTSRAVASALQDEKIISRVTVSNSPGASGTVALGQIAPQTGREGLIIASGLAMMSGVVTNKTEVGLDNLTPLARLMGESEVIVVPANSDIQTFDELIALIQKDPAAVPIAGGSAGSADHLWIGLVAQEYGIKPADINYIPYSGGGEATTALMGNQVIAGVSGTGEFQEQIKAGSLRALLVSSKETVSSVPDAPTVTDIGKPNLEFFNWRSIMAPKGLPDAYVAALISAIDTMHASATWKETVETNAWLDIYISGDEFGKWLTEENERVSGVLDELGLIQ